MKAILLKTLNLGFEATHFSQNVLFIWCNIYCYQFDLIFMLNYVSGGFEIYHLTFGDKTLRVLCLDIWKQVLETFQVSKRSLSDWFWSGPKCKSKVCSCLDNYSYTTIIL